MWDLKLAVWVHILGMVGAFGVLLGARAGLAREAAPGAARLAAWLLGVGFLAGLIVFGLLAHRGGLHPGLTHTVATKFVLLLVAGAGLGIGAKAARNGRAVKAGRAWLGALIALALAALLGITI